MAHDANNLGRRGSTRPNRGFTIVELLVVVAIIILLLSVVVVAMSAASRTAARSKTQFLMTSIKKGLVAFKTEIGYFPPVLGVPYTTTGQGGNPNLNELRRLYPNSVPTPFENEYTAGDYRQHMQEYWSTCSMSEYLIGYGNHRQDGYGAVDGQQPILSWSNETPPLGIRHPNDDGIWGASRFAGNLDQRMQFLGLNVWGSSTSPHPWDGGQIFGPYIELKDERLLAAISGYDNNGPILNFPGEANYDETHPKTIVDYWGTPIRYYRQPYPRGALAQRYQAGIDYDGDGNAYNDRLPSLADVFVLRPYDLPPGNVDVCALRDDNPGTFADCAGNVAAGDPTTAPHLFTAEFALFSAGPDRQAVNDVRRDDVTGDDEYGNEYNKDNIVEVGP